MAQIIPPKMNVFNYGQAVEQGNQNAMNEQLMKQMPERMQMQRDRHQTQQQGAELQQAQQGLNMMLQKGRFVSDQGSYDAWRQEIGALGIVQPEQMNPNYTPDYMNRVLGMTQDKLKNMTAEMRNYTFSQQLPEDKKKEFRGWKQSSAQERIAQDPSLAGQVAQTQAQITGSKARAGEQAKSEVQLKMRPQIQRAIKQAEVEAKSRGESFTSLTKAKAALPGLREVVDKLVQLSDVGTYTLTGRAYDEAVKQAGFGATKGSTARVKMTAIVNNQVLPLLRETFGAAFTVAEGESLRATLLDVNAAPEQKKATLDAFIEQKIRDIETKEMELKGVEQQPSGIKFIGFE